MTEDQADFDLLSLATDDTGKFAIAINCILPTHIQLAFERGLQNEWMRLIDIAFPAAVPNHLCRIFLLTKAGRDHRDELRKVHA